MASSFLREGLVDTLIITIAPIVLGEGIPLFVSGSPEVRLALTEAKTYDHGFVQLHYELPGEEREVVGR
jgi:dihydrofolate reductase